MGSDAQVQAPPVEPAAPAAGAAAGGSSMTMIIVAVVAVIVVVAAVVGYVMISGDGDSLELTGQWTVSGGEMKMTMVIDNDTANKTWINQTVPASTEVIDFDDPTTTPEGWNINDLGDGNFEITDFELSGADFGTVTGTYDINDDTMTITMSGSGTIIEDGMYMEVTFDYNVNFAKA